MITSAKMKLQVPTIGADNDPAWQSEIIYTFNKIDVHTHDGTSSGNKIPFNNLNFAQPGGSSPTPSMGNTPLTSLKYLGLTQQTTLLSSATTGTGVLELQGTSLYYIVGASQIKLADPSGPALSGTALNGITGGVYQALSGGAGNLSYTAGVGGTSYFLPGYHAAQQWIQNVFTFATPTTPTSTTSAPANITAATIYASGVSPSFYIYDFAAASSAVGSGQPSRRGYAAEFLSLGDNGSLTASSFQFGLRGRYAGNSTDAAYPSHVFSVNQNFNGNTLSPNGVVPFTHIFNASFTDGRSPSVLPASGDGYEFINYSATNIINAPQQHTYYVQYAISPTTGLMLSTSTANSEAGFGMQFRYTLQKPSAAVGSTPNFTVTSMVEAMRQEVFFSDSTNNATGYRMFLSASSSYYAPTFVLSFAPQTGALPGVPALQGVIGPNAIRSAHFPSGTIGISDPGFVFNVPLYMASTQALLPTHDKTSFLGTSTNYFGQAYIDSLFSNRLVPGATFTTGSGANYGLYTNTTIAAQGFVSGTSNSVTPNAAMTGQGANFASATALSAPLNGLNGIEIRIQLQVGVPGTTVVLAGIKNITIASTGLTFIQQTSMLSTSLVSIILVVPSGGSLPTVFDVVFQVLRIS